MEPWSFIRWGIAASVLAHLLIAGGIVVSTTVRPYEIPKAEEVPVDIVDPDEPQKTPEPVATPSPSPSPELTLPQLSQSPLPAAAAPPPPSQLSQEAKESPKPSSSPQPQAQQPPPAPSPKSPGKAAAKSEPKPAPTSTPAPAPSYVPPEPDLTVKYGVMLGLPAPLPPLPPGEGAESGSDAGPTATTNLADDLVTALRQHLKSCARLPASVSRADNVMVKLRVAMKPNGRLAAEPMLIAGTASVKALQLKQSAVDALNGCQPYSMLPPDRYGEWKVLEMSFTPQDFPG